MKEERGPFPVRGCMILKVWGEEVEEDSVGCNVPSKYLTLSLKDKVWSKVKQLGGDHACGGRGLHSDLGKP